MGRPWLWLLRRPLRDKINTGNVKLVPPGGLRQTVGLGGRMSVGVRHDSFQSEICPRSAW